jgi:Gpi18-like mannosyltransferase
MSSWIKTAARPALIALGIRTSVLGVSTLAYTLIEPRAPLNPLAIWNRWDGPWYISIAEHGYTFSPTGQSSVNFFPLFPSLLWFCAQPFIALHHPVPYLGLAILICWTAFTVATVLLHDIAKRRFGPSVAMAAVLLLGVYPFGFYFGAPYSESLFLCLSLAAFCCIERANWVGASAAALLAGVTRPAGVVVGICVIVAYVLASRRTHETKPMKRVDALAVVTAPLGVAVYAAYCLIQFHDPFAYFATAEAGWGHGHFALDGVFDVLHTWTTPSSWIATGSVLAVVRSIYNLLLALFLLAIIMVWRRLGLAYALYSLGCIALPLFSSDALVSTGRYLSVAFPIFMAIARSTQPHPTLRELLFIALSLFLALFSILFCFNFPLY